MEPTEDDSRFAVRLGLRMVKGLANAHAGTLVAARADQPFASLDDLWRRTRVPQAALVQLAEADAFRTAFGLARREALWAIRALRDEPLPLFAAASDRQAEIIPEVEEPVVALRPMTAGGEVVADYRHVGLTLRSHPVSFLRAELQARRMVSCAEAMAARDGRWLEAAGLVLVRQRPGSAKGVLFITLEDETGIANLVVWPQRVRAQPAHHPVDQHDGGARAHPARGRGRASGGAAGERPLRRACQRRRARGRLPAAARPRRPDPPWRLGPRAPVGTAQALPCTRPL